MDFKTIKPAVKQYIKNLKKGMPIDQVILFGSFAEGTAKKDSDVDLIILSEKFAEMSEDERLKFLYRRSVGFPHNLHAYGFTKKELDFVSPLTTLAEAKSKGRRIL